MTADHRSPDHRAAAPAAGHPVWDKAQFEALVANVPGAVYRMELVDWKVHFMSEGIELLSGHPASDYVGDDPVRSFASLIHPDDLEPAERAIHEHIARGEPWLLEFRVLHADGGVRWVYERGRGVVGPDGQVTYIDGAIFDNTERRLIEEERDALLARVEAMARTDALTGLPNRRAWDEELARELARSARGTGPVAVAMLDLDHFKAFNDEHGHLAGDQLLRELALQWRLAVRLTDVVARYGGEEFAVLLPDCSPDEAARVLQRLRAAVPLGQTCSAGIAYWDGSESAQALLGRADAALYAAKRAGRDRVVGAP